MAPARAIAKKFGAHVILLEVAPGYGQVLGVTAAQPYGTGVGALQAAAEVVAEAESAAEQYLDRVRSEHGQKGWETHVAEGDASTVIADFASATSADLIVMATHARSGLKRLFLGSVAEDVIRKTRVPVLITHTDSEA